MPNKKSGGTCTITAETAEDFTVSAEETMADTLIGSRSLVQETRWEEGRGRGGENQERKLL